MRAHSQCFLGSHHVTPSATINLFIICDAILIAMHCALSRVKIFFRSHQRRMHFLDALFFNGYANPIFKQSIIVHVYGVINIQTKNFIRVYLYIYIFFLVLLVITNICLLFTILKITAHAHIYLRGTDLTSSTTSTASSRILKDLIGQ